MKGIQFKQPTVAEIDREIQKVKENREAEDIDVYQLKIDNWFNPLKVDTLVQFKAKEKRCQGSKSLV